MKILNVITGLDYGGAERLLANSAVELAKEHQLTTCYVKGTAALLPQLQKYSTIIKLPTVKRVAFIEQLLQSQNFDILHTHLPQADFLGMAANRKLQIPAVCTLHNVAIWANPADYAVYLLYRTLLHTIAKNWRVVGISKSVTKHAQRFLRIPPGRLSTIPNGIPEVISVNRNINRSKLGLQDNYTFLFVGRLTYQKGVDVLLHAFSVHAAANKTDKLLIVGDGDKSTDLKKLAQQLGIADQVRFCGATNTPATYFSAADCLVLPSRFEGFGLVILEAFQMKLPVIASNTEGPAELIQNGCNGLLVEPGNLVELANAMLKVKTNQELAHTLGHAGLSGFKQLYSIKTYANTLESIYRDMLHNKKEQM